MDSGERRPVVDARGDVACGTPGPGDQIGVVVGDEVAHHTYDERHQLCRSDARSAEQRHRAWDGQHAGEASSSRERQAVMLDEGLLPLRGVVGAAEALRGKTSAKAESTFAEIPEFRVRLADAAMQFEAVPAQLETYTREFDELVDHGRAWPRKFVSAKLNATEAARNCVETAYRCAGGRGFDNGTELNRLYRDALAGMFHPSSWDVARPMFASALLDD